MIAVSSDSPLIGLEEREGRQARASCTGFRSLRSPAVDTRLADGPDREDHERRTRFASYDRQLEMLEDPFEDVVEVLDDPDPSMSGLPGCTASGP